MMVDSSRETRFLTNVIAQRGKSLFLAPLVAEQKRIVAKVDQLITLCDDLEAKLQRAQTDADNLLTAIVQVLVNTQRDDVA